MYVATTLLPSSHGQDGNRAGARPTSNSRRTRWSAAVEELSRCLDQSCVVHCVMFSCGERVCVEGLGGANGLACYSSAHPAEVSVQALLGLQWRWCGMLSVAVGLPSPSTCVCDDEGHVQIDGICMHPICARTAKHSRTGCITGVHAVPDILPLALL